MASQAPPNDGGNLTFGVLLQQYRQQAGLTQEGLAERAGISVRGLSDLERGVNAAPRRDTLALLLEALALAPESRAALVTAARSPARTSLPRAGASLSGSRSLPPLADPLIGREADVAKITALLQEPPVRLVTITGPGGIGKTRLAIAVGHRHAAAGHAVSWAPLAAARSASAALSMMATALGVEDRGATPLPDLLARTLQGPPLLLILDNLEQIPDLAPTLSHLLAGAPALTIVATSRAPLRLRGERRYHLPPLGLTPGSADAGERKTFSSPAGELFARRATEIDHEFTLTPQNSATVQAICDRLDGLPLAIELAAARSAVLPPAALLERLMRALPLLTGGPLDAPDRQRTLRDAIAWSYYLLDPETQWAFRQLGVCVGGFTLETAEHLTGDVASGSALDHVTDLLEQSLLRSMPGVEPTRYVMLETIREFAIEQLEAEGEHAAAYQRHARWFATHAEWLDARMFSPDELIALKGFDSETANMRQAMETLLQTQSEASLVQAAELDINLSVHWQLRGLQQESVSWHNQLLCHRKVLPPPLLADLLVRASAAHNIPGDSRAEDTAREAVQILHGLEGTPSFSAWSMTRAKLYLADCLDDPWERQAILSEGLAYARAGQLKLAEAFLSGMLCLAYGELGEAADALLAGEIALALQHELGGNSGAGHASGQFGHALRLLNRHHEALPHLMTSFRIAWEIGAVAWAAQALEGIASSTAQTGQMQRAAWIIGAASQLRLRSGWSVDLELFGRAPEIVQAVTTALGEQIYADLVSAGEAASWQELHDIVLGVGPIPSA